MAWLKPPADKKGRSMPRGKEIAEASLDQLLSKELSPPQAGKSSAPKGAIFPAKTREEVTRGRFGIRWLIPTTAPGLDGTGMENHLPLI
jgi:hypothetical protein